jgi:hypothetical protein
LTVKIPPEALVKGVRGQTFRGLGEGEYSNPNCPDSNPNCPDMHFDIARHARHRVKNIR